MKPSTVEAIKAAVRREASGALGAEDRFDLGQEIAVLLLRRETQPENLAGWIVSTVKTRVLDSLRDEKKHLETQKHLHAHGTPAYNVSLKRDPSANYMAIKSTSHGSGANDVEDAMIACVDARARARKAHAWAADPARTPTCAQDEAARVAMLAKRGPAPKSKST